MDKTVWKDNERLNGELKSAAKDLQGDIEALVKKWNKFKELALKTYKSMPKNDAMFPDSPLGEKRLEMAMRANFAKLGWKWAASLMWGPEGVRTFYEIVSDATTWGARIIKDEENLEKRRAQSEVVQKEKDVLASIT